MGWELYAALTVVALVGTIATGFGRAWGAALLALIGASMSARIVAAIWGRGGVEFFYLGTAAEIWVAVMLARGGRSVWFRVLGVLVGIAATLFLAFMALIATAM